MWEHHEIRMTAGKRASMNPSSFMPKKNGSSQANDTLQSVTGRQSQRVAGQNK